MIYKLIKCRVCQGIVAVDAICCPHCGHKAQLQEIGERERQNQEWTRKREQEREQEQQKKLRKEYGEIWRKQGLCPDCGGQLITSSVDGNDVIGEPCTWHYTKCKKCNYESESCT